MEYVTIASVPKASTPKNSGDLLGSLKALGYNRFPGTTVRKYPDKDVNGAFVTGLDENALYLRKMSKEDRDIELARIRDLKKRVVEMYGPNLDFGPRSDFYSKMNDFKGGTESLERCPVAVLKDGDNILNLSNPQHLIIYAYLRVHRSIAPSKSSLSKPEYANKAQFYIKNSNQEAEIVYKTNVAVDRAKAKLLDLTLIKRKQIARQLGLAVSDNTREEVVYNLLTDFISDSVNPGNSSNLVLFEKFLAMKDDNLLIRDQIKRAVEYNVIRKKGSALIRGEERLGKDFESAVEYLLEPKNQETLIAIQEELKTKESIKS